jgi:hypothetical protein
MRRLLALVLACCVCQGCFALDEIDKGQKIMEKHSPRAREAQQAQAAGAAAAAEKQKKDEEGWLDRAGQLAGGVKAWWAGRSERTPERDPTDVPVPCEIDGRMQFMRKSDCAIRGGTASG